MNEENFDFLKNQVKYSGFGDGLENLLKTEIQKEQPAFAIEHKPGFDNADFKATLFFRRSEESGMVFFNRFEAELKQKDEVLKQTFFIGKENNYTLKEAFNLMNGRAVHKELEKLEKVGDGENARYQGTGEKYKAWVQLDFKEADDKGNFKLKPFHENYGYNLEETLGKHQIKELNDPERKENLMQSLEKGNRQQVTFIANDEEKKGFVQANPQFKSLKLFDEHGKEIRSEKQQSQVATQSEKQKKNKSEKKTNNQSNKNTATNKRKGRGVA